MASEYVAAAANLIKYGIDPDRADEAMIWSRRLIRASILEEHTKITEAGEELRSFLESTGIADYLADRESVVSLDEALGEISNLGSGHIVGLTGKPASGKSTLCSYVAGDKVIIIDEFWETVEGNLYDQKVKSALAARADGKLVITAACQIISPIVDTKMHLVCPPEVRQHNLATRSLNLSDKLRAEFFEAYEANDNLLYGLERVNADFVVDTTRIRY